MNSHEVITRIVALSRNNLKYSPWFKEQSVASYYPGLQEEVLEVGEAIKKQDIANLKEELGDVLWDTLSLIALCEREHGFNAEEVIEDALAKFSRRKPHIVDGREITRQEEHDIWVAAKASEKGGDQA